MDWTHIHRYRCTQALHITRQLRERFFWLEQVTANDCRRKTLFGIKMKKIHRQHFSLTVQTAENKKGSLLDNIFNKKSRVTNG
jgi:hypothetical protein